jgi:hypothetical protein
MPPSVSLMLGPPTTTTIPSLLEVLRAGGRDRELNGKAVTHISTYALLPLLCDLPCPSSDVQMQALLSREVLLYHVCTAHAHTHAHIIGRYVLVNLRLVSESAQKRGVEWHVCELQLSLTCIALAMVPPSSTQSTCPQC